jgi:GH43 family beta-xylosidase
MLNFFVVPIIRTKNMQATNVSTFYNVIAQNGGDPWMYKHVDGWYYMTFTTGGDVRIWRSRSLTSIVAGDSILAWTPPGSGPACRDVWAPELHFIHSNW